MIRWLSRPYVHASGFAGLPLPAQKPHPPISSRWATAHLDSGRKARGHCQLQLRQLRRPARIGECCVIGAAETEQKLEWVRAGAGERFNEIELEIGAYFVAVSDNPAPTISAMANRFGVGETEFAAHPHALLGTVDTICATLQERRERFGFSYVTIPQRNIDEFAPVVARLMGT